MTDETGVYRCAYCRHPPHVEDGKLISVACAARNALGDVPLMLAPHRPPTVVVDLDALERRLFSSWRTGLVARLVHRSVAARREGDCRKADILDEVVEALKGEGDAIH